MSDELRKAALRLFTRTMAAIDVESVVRTAVHREGERLAIAGQSFDLNSIRRVLVIGIGKACVPMARAVEDILGDRITDGILVTNAVIGAAPARLPVLIGGHPVPNDASVQAATRALHLLRENDSPETLVLFLVTGGGSAMFEQPADASLTLEDLQEVNRILVGCGAVINEMNIVRRFLSAVKGGKLAAAAPASRQISLYISDVNDDDLATVASGPTIQSASNLDDFERVIAKYNLLENFPPAVRALIESSRIQPMPNLDAIQAAHHLLLDNRRALDLARGFAEEEGFVVEIAGDLIEGHVESMMLAHIERITMLRARHPGRRVCVLSGGEAICPVRGTGRGGRNQEFILRAAIHLSQLGMHDIVALSAGTDGIDGNSPAAGAIADSTTLERTNLSAEAHLINSDSFSYFNALGDAILIGPTGNNVRDLRIFLAQ